MTIKRVTVLVPDNLHRQLKLIAVKNDTTMQKIFLEALKMHLQQYKNNATDLE